MAGSSHPQEVEALIRRVTVVRNGALVVRRGPARAGAVRRPAEDIPDEDPLR